MFRDGLIVAVGANVTAPADARVIDGTGLTVYPGIIDANTTLAIPRPSPTPGGGGGAFAGLFGQSAPSATSPNSPNLPGMQLEILASDLIRPGGPEIEAARNAGITTAHTAPRGNVFLGQSALINLAGDTPQQMVVRSPVAQYIGLQPLGGGQYPGSLMGVFASVRQMLLDTRRYREMNEIYERNPRGQKRPAQDKSLEALLPVVAGRMPIVMQADSEREIERVLDLAREFNVRVIINGGRQADRVAARLKSANIPVLLSLNFPRRTTAASPDADPEPLRVLRERVEAPKTAGRLAAAGVRFAFQSGGMASMNDYLANVGKTVENGLSRDDAVRALTIWPAEVLGVASQLGTIEVGKIANLTVTRSDLFARDRRIAHVFIDGKPIESATPDSSSRSRRQRVGHLVFDCESYRGWKRKAGTDRDAEPATGRRASDGIASGTTRLRKHRDRIDLGAEVNFTVPITLPAPASQTTDAMFVGTVRGNQMSGTVQVVGRGPGTFTATRAGRPEPAASPSPTP